MADAVINCIQVCVTVCNTACDLHTIRQKSEVLADEHGWSSILGAAHHFEEQRLSDLKPDATLDESTRQGTGFCIAAVQHSGLIEHSILQTHAWIKCRTESAQVLMAALFAQVVPHVLKSVLLTFASESVRV